MPEATSKSMSESSPSAQSSAIVNSGRLITRNRASYSCHTCRRRKVKCDKVHPICGNCSKNGAKCVYNTATPKKNDDADADDELLNQHGTKRRKRMSQSVDDNGDDAQSIPGEPGKSDTRSGSHAIEARLDKLTNMIESLSKAKGPLPVKEMSRQLQSISQDIDGRIPLEALPATPQATASKTKPASRADSPRRTADLSGDEFPIPAGNATDPVDPVGSLNLGHLSLEDGKSRYVGSTYWAYISDEINELNQLLREQNRAHEEPPSNEGDLDADAIMIPADQSPMAKGVNYHQRHRSSPGNYHSYRSLLFPSKESPIATDRPVEHHMLEDMPTRRQSDILYRGFMSGVHAISPVLHPPTILQSYLAFWDWYEHNTYSGERYPDPSFIPLLYAIWHGGSVTISIRTIKAEFPGFASRSALSDVLHEHVIGWLDRVSFPRNPTLHALVALLITRTILSREEEPLASSVFISTVLRVAQAMGLHRDPAQFGIQSSEAETRRRIWWHIIHMDGVVSMSSGLPPLVCDENYWDVRETSEVKDTLLGTSQAEQYSRLVESNLRPRDNPDDPTVCGGSSMVNVFYLCARGKYVMARAVRRIMKIQLGTKPVTGRDMEELRSILVDLQFQLNSLLNRIPLAQHPNSIKSDNNHSISPNMVSWSPSQSHPGTGDGVLPGDDPSGCAEQYHTPVLVAFHKWARILLSLFVDKAFCVAYQPFLKNAKSRIWPAARQGALRHCHGFMEKFIALATDPDFQPFQWSWPGNHQPMHATMIMLIDLYERPSSPQALRSRAFIDKIFSMSGPDGGVVGGEDGVTTARPLKDGGREAWDMMRRLREKAWQKAGLDPEQLWTEQAQIQAGVAQDQQQSSSQINKKSGYGAISKSKAESQIAEFNKRFYDMTRAQTLPNPIISSLRQEPPRHSPVLSGSGALPMPPLFTTQSHANNAPSNLSPSAASIIPNLSLDHQSLDATLTLANLATGTVIGSPTPTSHGLLQQQPHQHRQLNHPSHNYPILSAAPSSSSPSFSPINSPQAASTSTSTPAAAAAAPTPPSMVDPNLSFDWDQWDAVFGQQLHMADELSELDPVAGGMELGLTDLGIDLLDPMTGSNTNNHHGGGTGGGDHHMSTTSNADPWRDFESWQY